jgi:hypothetical protein
LRGRDRVNGRFRHFADCVCQPFNFVAKESLDHRATKRRSASHSALTSHENPLIK